MRQPKILVIDDDIDHLSVCQILFRRNNYDIFTTAGYSKITDLFKDIASFQPDLIFLDHNMPGIHGGLIMKALRHNKATESIPLVYLSANSDISFIAQLYGADGYICKPYDIDHLLKITKELTSSAA